MQSVGTRGSSAGVGTLLVVASHAVVQTPAGWQHTEAATN